MAKLKKLMVIFILFISTFAPVTNLNASITWDEWNKRINVPVDKVWQINFNTPMDPSTITKDNVYIFNYKSLSNHPINLDLSKDGKVLKIHPEKPYILGENYTLHIKQTVKSIQGKEMKQSIKLSFQTSKDYQVATMNGIGDFTPETAYDSLHHAKQATGYDSNQVILEDSQIVWMADGIVTTNKFAIIYKDQQVSSKYSDSLTYVTGDTELQYLDTVDGAVMVKVGEEIGYISPDLVRLTPTRFIAQRSYYTNMNGNLVHYVYRSGKYEWYTYGPSPETIQEGEMVFSWDGETFNDIAYPFFNKLSIRTKTNYTAEQIDAYIENKRPDSPLIGLGSSFIEAQEKFNVNALYLMAHAIHESAWGTSKIAKDKNNLFGLNATDSNPYGNADVFNSLEDCIMYAADFVDSKYLNPSNFRYHGDYLGNKAGGLNVMYASDPYWGQKIAGHMYRADQFLGGLDQKLLTPEVEAAETTEELADMTEDTVSTEEVNDDSTTETTESTDTTETDTSNGTATEETSTN